MQKNHINTILLLLLTPIIIIGCGDEASNNSTPDSFDRVTFLAYYADSLIIPEYAKLNSDVEELKTSIEGFVSLPDEQSLKNAQNAWYNAYMQWQNCSAFDFGPAQGNFGTLSEDVGTFPSTITGSQSKKGIEEYIAAGDNSLSNFARDTRGFLGIEYLLFESDDNNVVNKFQSAEGEKRKAYLIAITNDIVIKINDVYTKWSQYRSKFIENNGTDAGSSTSELYNEFVKSFEALKNYKYGLPAGKRPGQTKSEPDKVEGFYSGTSFETSKKHWETIQRLWQGKTTNGYDGIGFEEYVASTVTGKDLVHSTQVQIKSVNDAFNTFPNNITLSQAITTNEPSVETINTELQKMTRFLKSDMSSLLGISITYSSGDGD